MGKVEIFPAGETIDSMSDMLSSLELSSLILDCLGSHANPGTFRVCVCKCCFPLTLFLPQTNNKLKTTLKLSSIANLMLPHNGLEIGYRSLKSSSSSSACLESASRGFQCLRKARTTCGHALNITFRSLNIIFSDGSVYSLLSLPPQQQKNLCWGNGVGLDKEKTKD